MTPFERVKQRAEANGHPAGTDPPAVPVERPEAADPELVGVPAAHLPTFKKLKQLRRRDGANGHYWRSTCPCGCGHHGFGLAFTKTGELVAGCVRGCDPQTIANALGVKVIPITAEAAAGDPTLRAAAVPRFEWLSWAEFMGGDFRPEWLIKNVMVRGEPFGMGGPMKALKSSIAVDMAVSLATGSPFLGKFDVPAAVPVALVSGESGRSTLQDMCRRACEARGIRADGTAGNLHWCFDIPCFSDAAGVAIFADDLLDREVKVAILDPLYLMLGSVNAANMFEVGGVLRTVASALTSKGITPVVLHHARKPMTAGAAMELADLSHSGFAEFVRQFLLLNRVIPFEANTGHHELIANIGGSAGHSGRYVVEVEEGVMDEYFAGRYWQVKVTNENDVVKAAESDREAKQTAKVREKLSREEQELLSVVDTAKQKGEPAATKNVIRQATGWQNAKVNDVLDRLFEAETIQLHKWKKAIGSGATREVEGYRRPVPVEQIILPFGNHAVNGILPHGLTTWPDGVPGSSEGASGDHVGELPPIGGHSPTCLDGPEPREGAPSGVADKDEEREEVRKSYRMVRETKKPKPKRKKR